jgi:hypothetical protein
MNELRRMAYLEALGVDSYVSRRQLPGAALTRRLLIHVTSKEPPVLKEGAGGSVLLEAGTTSKKTTRPDASSWPEVAPRVRAQTPVPAPAPDPAQGVAPVPRFSLITIVAGDWLWLEEITDMPLATEQVQLVQSMARALLRGSGDGRENVASADARVATKPEVGQFDWPMHTNRQLDLSEDAARASVVAFISRTLEKHGCRGVVLLGQSTARRVPLSELRMRAAHTASSAEILARPALKRQVWLDLQSLLGDS